MKRKVAVLAGVGALALAVYLGSRLTAQTSTVARPTSKIAVINVPLVIKHYKKYQTYEGELKKIADGYEAEEAKLKKEMLSLQELAQKPEANRDKLEEDMKELKRRHEDLGQRFKKEMGKKQEDQLVQLYKEIEAMVARVAVSRGFEMVLQYTDVIEAKDKYNPVFVQRKVLGGMCLPLYIQSGLDISGDVIANLNYPYEHAATGRQ